MSELTDDQLDGLFIKSAEEFRPSFDSAAWQDMKARLDVNDRITPTGGPSPVKQNVLRWGLPILVLMLLVGWSIYKPVNLAGPAATPSSERKPRTPATVADKDEFLAANQPNDKEVASVKLMRTPKQAVTSTEPVTDLKRVTSERRMLESRNDVMPPQRTKTVKSSEHQEGSYKESVGVSEMKRASRSPLDKLSLNKPLSMAANVQTATSRSFGSRNRTISRTFDEKWGKDTAVIDVTAKPNSKYFLKSRPIPDKQHGTNTVEDSHFGKIAGNENESTEKENEQTAVSSSLLKELAIRPAKWTQLPNSISRSVEVQPSTEGVKIAPQPAAMRGLSVRFVVAPDLSGVGLKNFSRPGTNTGLLLEYRLAPRWSVQAGLIQSTKVYRTLTSEYEVPAGWWKAPMKTPESVDGRCTMFDIPINIRYDVVIKPRLDGRLPTRWFASGGVTSYIMQNEEYYYNYPPHTYNQPTEYDVSTGGYGFSNLNLSVGYERSISRRLSWQVEPFMKVPLKGVGNFKVRLLSTGTFFSLRYKL